MPLFEASLRGQAGNFSDFRAFFAARQEIFSALEDFDCFFKKERYDAFLAKPQNKA